jgi:uncharacterized membrane protein
MDELEWYREDASISDAQRDQAVSDLIELVGAVDQILQHQSKADTHYFLSVCGRTFDANQVATIQQGMLDAYRWQYIVSGVQEPRFAHVLSSMVNDTQLARIQTALAPIVNG